MRTILLLLAVTTATTHADAPKYKRAQATVEVHLSDRTKVKPPPAKVEPAQPTATAEQVFAGLERAEPTRREQEDLLVGLVRDTPEDDPDKPDLMFRLAEHYAKQHMLWHMKALEPDMPRTQKRTKP